MPRYLMTIDASKCMNCKACIVACQQRNGVPYTRHRNWVRETENKSSPSGWLYQPGACMHCADAPCVRACPTRATFKAADGTVGIDAGLCIGCGSCIVACPYGARYKHPTTGRADKCDYCATSRKSGLVPACVLACATRCRIFGDADNPDDPVSKTLAANQAVYVIAPGQDTHPTLTYLNSTTPTDWPRQAHAPLPISLMGAVAAGVKALGALSLFGVIGLVLKQLVLPSEEKEHRPPAPKPKGGDK